MIEPSSTDAVLFDFDGTLAPNLDLADMRQQIVNLTVKAGVPSNIYESLYIVEVIEAGYEWLEARDADQAAHYQAQANQKIKAQKEKQKCRSIECEMSI